MNRFFLSILAALFCIAGRARGAWNVEAILSAPDWTSGLNRFGAGLEMSGNTIVVGAPDTDDAPVINTGAIYSYERDAGGQWNLTQILRYPNEAANSYIGSRMAMEGNTLLVPVTVNAVGRVLVYERTAPGALWAVAQTLTGDQADEAFGQSVALSGNIMAVGAQWSGTAPQTDNRPGAVYIFVRSGPSSAWTRSQKIVAPPAAGTGNRFGATVRLNSQWLFIVARDVLVHPNQTGATYAYYGGPGNYTLVDTLAPVSPYILNMSDVYVRDGMVAIAMGDDRNPDNLSQSLGAVFAWNLNGNAVGPVQKLTLADRSSAGRFGDSVATEGDAMAVGAPYTNSWRGAVFLWSRAPGGLWTEGAHLERAGLSVNASYGERVLMGSGRLVVAAPVFPLSSVPGSVYVYRDGPAPPLVSAGTGPAAGVSTHGATLTGSARSEGTTTAFVFDVGTTTAYEMGSFAAGTLNSAMDTVVQKALDGLTINTTYHYRLRGGAAVGLDTTFTTASGFSATLADAVDAPSLNWESYGTKSWLRQTTTTFDGSDAAKADAITHSQSSTLETSVTGPGTLTFRWKVSSEPTYDWLTLRNDGVQVQRIAGNVDWTLVSVPIASGFHRLAWEYSKDTSTSAGSDTAWVDTVTWTPDNTGNAFAQWQSSVFTPAQLANPAISGPAADPDGDGLKNAVEAHFGSAPLAAGGSPLTLTAAAGALTLHWPEASPAPGTVAVPEWSPDSVTWLASGQSLNGIPPRTITVSPAGGSLKQAALNSSGLTRALLRLRITVP